MLPLSNRKCSKFASEYGEIANKDNRKKHDQGPSFVKHSSESFLAGNPLIASGGTSKIKFEAFSQNQSPNCNRREHSRYQWSNTAKTKTNSAQINIASKPRNLES